MTQYADRNFKTKKDLIAAVKGGERISVSTQTPWGQQAVENGRVALSGPWYPEPHRWYAQGIVKDGALVSVK